MYRREQNETGSSTIMTSAAMRSVRGRSTSTSGSTVPLGSARSRRRRRTTSRGTAPRPEPGGRLVAQACGWCAGLGDGIFGRACRRSGMPRPTPTGTGALVARLPGVAGAGAAYVDRLAVGDQVVRRGVGDLGGDHVAGPDVAAPAGGEVHEPVVAARGRRAGGWRRPCGPRPRRPSARPGGRPPPCSRPRRRRRPARPAAGSGPSRRPA